MSTTIYIAMIHDRHAEPEAYPFSTAEGAIAFAREAAEVNARDPQDIEESAIDGWLFYARYSGEGDSVWVTADELDDATQGEGWE